MISSAILLRPLALHHDGLNTFRAALSGQVADASDTIEASRFRGRLVSASAGPLYRVENGTAIITVVGNLVSRGGWTGARSGLTSYEGIRAQFAAALADPAVSAIVLDIDSPGGEATGAMETGAMIRAAASRKPVTAVVNGMAASAGYALASGANQILIGASSSVGSIGILAMHMDHSQRLERAGIKPTLIHAGARKAERSSARPLDNSGRASMQAEVDQLYGLFVDLVAAHRRIPAAAVKATEAAMFTGAAAVKAKLADKVGTLDDALPAPSSPSTVTQMSTSTPQRTSSVAPNRLAAILAMPEAKGFEAEAHALAVSATPLDTIRAQLGALQTQAAASRQKAVDASWAQVMTDMKTITPTAKPSTPALAQGWGDVVAAVNGNAPQP